MSTKFAKDGYKIQTDVPAECATEGWEGRLVWGTTGSEEGAKQGYPCQGC